MRDKRARKTEEVSLLSDFTFSQLRSPSFYTWILVDLCVHASLYIYICMWKRTRGRRVRNGMRIAEKGSGKMKETNFWFQG